LSQRLNNLCKLVDALESQDSFASQLLIFSADNLVQKRFQNDMSINNSTVEILQDQQWVSIPWRKLQVGDIVKVSLSLL